ncbi:MAG: helix-turn-helix domain-containing protein [Mesorhizobium sp.]
MRRLPDPKEDVDARGNRFGENSKRFALQRISAALSAGMTITEAATTVGISRATYYRWINSSGSELDRQSNQNITIVGTLIDDLTRPDATVSQVRRAVVLFSLWLSNPANSLMFQGALPYFLLSYWNIKAPNSKLFDLPVEAHDDMNNINIEDILLSYNYSIDIGWHGEQFNLPGVNYSERDIFSEWAWYFIASYSEGFFPKK